jgi:hypothetical protein
MPLIARKRSTLRNPLFRLLVGTILITRISPAGKIQFTRDMKIFRQSVLSLAPLGSTEAETMKKFEAEKFTCFPTAGEFYPMDADGKFSGKTVTNAQMLFCYYQAPGIWSNDKWRAVFLLREGRTADVFVMFHVISL